MASLYRHTTEIKVQVSSHYTGPCPNLNTYALTDQNQLSKTVTTSLDLDLQKQFESAGAQCTNNNISIIELTLHCTSMFLVNVAWKLWAAVCRCTWDVLYSKYERLTPIGKSWSESLAKPPFGNVQFNKIFKLKGHARPDKSFHWLQLCNKSRETWMYNARWVQ